MGERNYFEHDNDFDLIEFEPQDINLEIHGGIVVESEPMTNPEHITGEFLDCNEVR